MIVLRIRNENWRRGGVGPKLTFEKVTLMKKAKSKLDQQMA